MHLFRPFRRGNDDHNNNNNERNRNNLGGMAGARRRGQPPPPRGAVNFEAEGDARRLAEPSRGRLRASPGNEGEEEGEENAVNSSRRRGGGMRRRDPPRTPSPPLARTLSSSVHGDGNPHTEKKREKEEEEEESCCRICRDEGSAEEPLYHPCDCAGTMRFVHESCLKQWVEKKSDFVNAKCELCAKPLKFRPIYADNVDDDFSEAEGEEEDDDDEGRERRRRARVVSPATRCRRLGRMDRIGA